jgi:hypothetical protein
MPIEQETVPCETCGDPTTYTGTKRCNNCYEVESRLDSYLQNPKALLLLTGKLRELELKHGAAQAIDEFDEDELEEYSAKLDEARAQAVAGMASLLESFVREDHLDDVREFIVRELGINKLTLQQIKDRYRAYLPEWCPHDELIGECTACDVAGDLAYDAAREDRP